MRERILQRRRGWGRVGLDLTPMTDVVFLVLTFFLLSSSFIAQSSIPVQLPKARSAQVQAEKRLLVSLNAEGHIFLNRRRILKKDLSKELSRQLAAEKDLFVILRADERVSHGSVVEILDLARTAGAARLAIATDEKK